MRSVAFATFAAGAPLGAAVGNTLGAILTQLSDPTWRSVFFLSTGLNALCMIGGAFSMDPDQPSPETDKRVDYIGAFLVTTGLTLIIFVLSDGSIAPRGWGTSYIIALLILGVLSIVAFIFWQHYLEKRLDDVNIPTSRKFPPPIMRLSLWTRANGRFAVMQLITFLNWCSFMSYNFWVQLFYQDYLQLSPVQTMLRLLPMFVTGVVCNLIVALVVGRVDVVYLMLLGTSLTASANVFFAVVKPSETYWAYGLPSAILSVFGADFVFSAGTLFIAKVALPHEQSVAGALFQTMTQLGTSFGLAITTLVFDHVRRMESAKLGVTAGDGFDSFAPPRAQLLAYRAAEWGGFGFGIAAAILCFFLRGVGIVGQRDNEDEVQDSQPSSPATLKSRDFEVGKTDSPSSTPPTI
jgi:predicted MFS family arabinose efflux permease